MKRRKNSFNLLFNINIGLAFNKKSLFTLILSLILLIGYLVFIAYNNYDKDSYLLAYSDIHYIYYREGLFLINIINSLLLFVFINILFVNSDSFDSMYVSFIPRKTIFYSKLLALIYLELLIVLVEFSVLIIPAFVFFPYFKIELNQLDVYLYILIFGMVQIGMTLFLLNLNNNTFTPMLGFLVNFILLIINLGFKNEVDNIEKIVPVEFIDFEVPYIGILLFIMGIIVYKLNYNVKNIN